MKQFTYVVKNPLGFHVRHASLISNQVKEYPDTLITLTKGAETIKADQLLKLLTLGIKSGDTITLTCDGEYEQNAVEVIGEIITETL